MNFSSDLQNGNSLDKDIGPNLTGNLALDWQIPRNFTTLRMNFDNTKAREYRE